MAKSNFNKAQPRYKFTEPEGKSKGILDDYAVRKNVSSKEGTIEHTPTNSNHIANKSYVDNSINERIPIGTDAGQMVFWDSSNNRWEHTDSTESPELVWDDVNKRLGIGTASPTKRLSITKINGDADLSFNSYSLNISATNNFLFVKSHASEETAGTTQTNEFLGTLRFYGYSNLLGNPYLSQGALISVKQTGNAGLLNIPTEIKFLTTSSTGTATQMILSDSGKVGINTTSPDTTLQVVGDCKLGDDNTNYVEIGTTGDVVFVGGAGLCFGEIFCNDANDTLTITSSGQANKVQVTSFTTNGASNNSSPDHTNDHITITKAGHYMCNVSISARSTGGTTYQAGFSVYKNNGATEFLNCHAHRNLSGGGGDSGSVSISGIIDLAVNDTIELWAWNETNTNNIIMDDVTLSLTQIGGT